MNTSGSTIGRTFSPRSSRPFHARWCSTRRAEAADRALLDGDQHLVVRAPAAAPASVVQRLGEPGVGHRRRQPARRQLVGRLQRIRQPRAERQDRDRCCPRARRGPCPISSTSPRAGIATPTPVAARIAQARAAGRRSPPRSPPRAPARPRPTAPSARSPAGSPDRPGRRLPACVAPSAPTRPGAVQREAHRQALDRHVVHHLVVGALQEGRIDRAERLHPLGRQAGGEGHRVLLGDADVEACARETACRTCPARCPTASPR